jgi:hypothetical protein
VSQVAAMYYRADSENGDHVDDPSEDALFMLIDDLNDSDNTFVVIQPDQDDPTWYVSVAIHDGGGYELVRRDVNRQEHDVIVESGISRIANDLIVWLSARNFPEQPARQEPSDF